MREKEDQTGLKDTHLALNQFNIYSLPNKKISDKTKFPEFADDNFTCDSSDGT